MKLMIGTPGTGKTKEILELSARNNVPVLCESDERKERLLVKAQGYGVYIPTPIVFNEDLSNVEEVYVDDVQRLFDVMLDTKVSIASVNIVSDIIDLG